MQNSVLEAAFRVENTWLLENLQSWQGREENLENVKIVMVLEHYVSAWRY